MARRSTRGTDESGGRREGRGVPDPQKSLRAALKFTSWTLGVVAVVFTFAWLLFQGEQFLAEDPRFVLPPENPSADEDAVSVHGLKTVPRAAILRVFRGDRGRGLIELDPEKKRMQLRTVDWVRDARVSRAWPNRLDVEIEERQPVAFVQIPTRMTGSFANPVTYAPRLIDADGVILKIRGQTPPNLPLLLGIRETDEIEKRRARVHLMMRLMSELKGYSDRVSEVDVTDTEAVRVSFQLPDRQAILVLGNERFRDRLKLLLENYEGIRERLPEKPVLDISLDGRITAIQGLSGETR
jgi:hypothetical protein